VPDTKLSPSTDEHPVLRHRLMPAALTFLVVAVGIYLTAYAAIGIIQHIVMPILAVLVGGWLSFQVYKRTGRRPPAS
jgi:hypothetical protein